MLRYEWKKMLICQKGLLLLLLFFALRMVLLYVSDKPSEDRAVYTCYQEWVQSYSGALNDEKIDSIETLMQKIAEDETTLSSIYEDYAAGSCDLEELNSRLEELEAKEDENEGFQQLVQQYYYALQDTEHRYLLDITAWDKLLGKEELNFPLLILVLLLTLLVFGNEQKSEMEVMIRTSRLGERCAVKDKYLCLAGVTVSVTVLDYLAECGMLQYWYGFTHGDYPLQSLSYFASGTRSISLAGTAVAILLLRILGMLFFMGLCSLFIYVTKRYAAAFLISAAVIILPYYGISPDYLRYDLPLPVGFLMGSGYFRGDEFANSSYTGQESVKYLFREIGTVQIAGVLVVSVLLLAGIMLFIKWGYTNQWRRKRLFPGVRAALSILLCFCLSVTCMGCTASSDANASGQIQRIYNSDNRLADESEDYIIYLDESDSQNWQLHYRNKETGEDVELIRDVFYDSKKYHMWPIFVTDNKVYYFMESNTYESTGYDRSSASYDTIHLMCLDLETFVTKAVFSANSLSRNSVALGLGTYEDEDAEFYSVCENFWVEGDTVYWYANNILWELNVKTKTRRKLVDGSATGDVAFDGTYFYYTNSHSALVRYDVDTGETKTYTNVIINQNFQITERGVIYKNRLYDSYLYYYRWDTGESELLVKENVLCFSTDGVRLYYYSDIKESIYGMNLEDKTSKAIMEKSNGNHFFSFREYGYLCIPQYDEETNITEMLFMGK